MSNKTVPIRVSIEDRKRMMVECRNLFLKEHPEFKSMNLTQAFMFNKLVEFYLKA